MEGQIKITELLESKENFSIEVTPEFDVKKLDKLPMRPSFISVTWHSSTHRCKNLEIPSIKMVEKLGKMGYNVAVHVSCDFMRRQYCDELLVKLEEIGVRNIFVVRGENFQISTSDFPYAKDLVSYIREKTKKCFCVGVAAYPDQWNDATKMENLKLKVKSGADFIITQAILDISTYNSFKKRCTELEIQAKIIPGIILFGSFKELEKFSELCSVKISGEFVNYTDEKTISCKRILKDLINNISDKNVHYFTMNKIDSLLDIFKT